jgi:AsmA protein
MDFKNGKLKGVNLLGLLKNPNGAQGSDDSTDFSEFSGTYTIAKGVMTTNDLKLAAPLLRMTGAGTVDLPNWQDNLLLKPTLVASRQGQSSKGDESGIVIPVAVEGPLDHPRYKPDLRAALQENLKDPGKLRDNVRSLLKGGGGLLR